MITPLMVVAFEMEGLVREDERSERVDDKGSPGLLGDDQRVNKVLGERGIWAEEYERGGGE